MSSDYLVSAPGHNLVILEAGSTAEARRTGRELLGVAKLPKGTVVRPYTNSGYKEDWDRHYSPSEM